MKHCLLLLASSGSVINNWDQFCVRFPVKWHTSKLINAVMLRLIICRYYFVFFSRLRANLPKNRYTDVLCYDDCRVLLSQIDGDPCSDYINANFVDGYKQKNAFISTQGKITFTLDDSPNSEIIWTLETLKRI